jgi:hypothetical protein
MLRKRLLLLKDLLFRPIYNAVYSIITAVGIIDTIILHIPALKNYFGGLEMSNLIIGIMFFISRYWFYILIAIATIAVFEGAYQTKRKYEWVEPDVSVYPSNEMGVAKYKDGELYNIAQLEVFNNEDIEITNCYATLEYANDIFFNQESNSVLPLIPSLTQDPDSIRWRENKSIEITIPAHKSRHLDVADTLQTFHYNLCNGDLDTKLAPLHTVKIRIDGHFDKKAMKFLEFDGYIYTTNLGKAEEAFVKNGRIKNKDEILLDNFRYLKMIFRKGGWKKDVDIDSYLKIN